MQWNPAVWVSDTKQYLVEVRTEFRKVTWPTAEGSDGRDDRRAGRDRADHGRALRWWIWCWVR